MARLMLRRGHAIAITVMVVLLAGACGSDGPGACRFKSIAALTHATYGVSLEGGLWTWGWTWWGQNETAPTQLRYTNDIVAIAAREFVYACEEHANGSRICWPALRTGSDSIDLSAAQQVAMSLGYSVCMLGRDGNVACADYGDDGIPPLDLFSTVEGLGGDVTDVALGPSSPAHGCAIKADRSLWCWGVGILGDGMPSRDTPSPAVGIEAARGVVEGVALGDTSTCVVTTRGAVSCWGPIVDPVAPALTPVVVDVDASFVEVTMGVGHACALTDDGQVWCWGDNDSTQTSAPDPTDRAPHRVPLPAGQVLEVRAGGDHSCARLVDSSVWCWGANEGGQLGDARITRAASSDPVAVVGCQ